MVSLIDLAQRPVASGPDVTGGITRGLQGRQILDQTRQAARQRRGQIALDTLTSGPLPTEPAARQAAQQTVAQEGGFEAFNAARKLFGEMDAAQGARELAEGRTIASALSGVTDQPSYDRAVAGLQGRGIDTSTLSPAFDPAQRDFLVNVVQEVEDVATMTPAQFNQEIALREAGRSGGTNLTVNTGTSPIGKLINDLNSLRASGAGEDDPGVQALERQIQLLASEGLTEEAAAAASEESRLESAVRTANVVSNSAGNIRRMIEEAILPTTAFAGSLLSNIGGTAARDVAAELDTIRANVAFGSLQEMRNNSPTGGALGQVSERELALLSSTLGNLEQSQSKPQLLRNLDNIEREFQVLSSGTPEQRDALLAAFETSQNVPTGDTPPDPATAAKPTSQADYDALPVGAWYIDPDSGNLFRKTR